jgi:hypothetical protein
MLDTETNRLETVGGFRNDRHTGDFQKTAHAPSNDGVIVGHEHTHEDISLFAE